MTDIALLIEDLAGAVHLPVAALRKALEHPRPIAEATLPVLERAAEGSELSERQANLLFWGLHVMAHARDHRAYEPLLRLLRQDLDVIDAALGDAASSTLPQVLASVFDGPEDKLFRDILDSSRDDGIRQAMLTAATFLCLDGLIARISMHDLLVRFDDAKAAVEGDIGWSAWEEAIAILGFRDLVPRVEAARRTAGSIRNTASRNGSRRPCGRPSAARTTGSACRKSTATSTIPSRPSNGPRRVSASRCATRSRMSAATIPAPAARARSSRSAASARSRRRPRGSLRRVRALPVRPEPPHLRTKRRLPPPCGEGKGWGW